MKIKLKVPKPRNPIALAASQRNGGGVHDKAEKTRRRDSRQALRQALKQGRDDVPPFLWLTSRPAAWRQTAVCNAVGSYSE